MQLWQLFLTVGGGIVLAGNVGAVFMKIIKPAVNVNERVKELENHDKKDFETLKELKESNKYLLEGMVVLLDHAATGNSIDKCKQVKSDLIHHLANK